MNKYLGRRYDRRADRRRTGLYIAREMEKLAKRHGLPCKTIRVEMLYAKEVGEFIHKVEEAHRAAGKSKLVFKTRYAA